MRKSNIKQRTLLDAHNHLPPRENLRQKVNRARNRTCVNGLKVGQEFLSVCLHNPRKRADSKAKISEIIMKNIFHGKIESEN